MGLFRVLIYGIIFCSWSITLFYDVVFMPRFYRNWWLAKLCFITTINLLVQTVYFGLAFIVSVLDIRLEKTDTGPHKRHPSVPSYWPGSKLHNMVNFVYATGAFPLGMVTSLLFWSLYLVEPTYVIPEWVEPYIPKWFNHMVHTASVPFLLVDTLLVCHRMPIRKTGSTVIVGFIGFYLTIIGIVKLLDGFWVYPIFDLITPFQRCLLIFFGGLVFWMLYLFGDLLNNILWGILWSILWG